MDNNGQMTFSDDPVLNSAGEVYSLIEEGRFGQAVLLLDRLMSANPDYPGLIESYRTSRFWQNRAPEFESLPEGKKTADFLMAEWKAFEEYAAESRMYNSSAYRAAMKHVFYRASENYRKAFLNQEETADNFDLLLNLGECFLKLGDFEKAIETLEYAGRSYNSNARLLSILGEAFFHTGDIPKSLWFFKEAFFVNPSDIDLSMITAEPVVRLKEIVLARCPGQGDVREWIPVYGFIEDVFYVRKNLQERQVESIKDDIYRLEMNYQRMNRDQIEESNVVPRLINKYLWLIDYFEFQSYSFENLTEIRTRLIKIDRNLFEDFFKKSRK